MMTFRQWMMQMARQYGRHYVVALFMCCLLFPLLFSGYDIVRDTVIISSGFTVAVAIFQFRFLYQRNAAIFMMGVPLKRRQLFHYCWFSGWLALLPIAAINGGCAAADDRHRKVAGACGCQQRGIEQEICRGDKARGCPAQTGRKRTKQYHKGKQARNLPARRLRQFENPLHLQKAQFHQGVEMPLELGIDFLHIEIGHPGDGVVALPDHEQREPGKYPHAQQSDADQAGP